MDEARKNDRRFRQEWIPVGRAIPLVGVKSNYMVLVLALKGEIEAEVETETNRVYISLSSIERYVERQNNPVGNDAPGRRVAVG